MRQVFFLEKNSFGFMFIRIDLTKTSSAGIAAPAIQE
jgi:hypothetical protein